MSRIFFLMIVAAISCKLMATVPIDSISDKQLLTLAYQYKYGIIRETNPEKAAKILMRLARKGNAVAMNELGKMYLNGDGVEKNTDYAYRLFKRASLSGELIAKCNLALMHQKGLGVPVNCKKAFQLYKEAADAELPQGYYGAGYLMYKGHGVAQNYEEAEKLLRKGSDKHHPACSFLLAVYYASGYNGKQDFDKAKEMLDRASNDGHGWTVDITKYQLLDSISRHYNVEKRLKKKTRKYSLDTGMRAIQTTTEISNLTGEWTGTVYTYDWSKKHILNEEDIKLLIENCEDSISVKYYVGDSLVTESAPHFKNGKYVQKDLKEFQASFPWIITELKFEQKDNVLFAELTGFNRKLRDFKEPMMCVLEKAVPTNMASVGNDILSIEKLVPTSEGLNLVVKSDKSMKVKIDIYSVTNSMSVLSEMQCLSVGNNPIMCQGSFPKGVYVVKVTNSNIESESHSKKITVGDYE